MQEKIASRFSGLITTNYKKSAGSPAEGSGNDVSLKTTQERQRAGGGVCLSTGFVRQNRWRLLPFTVHPADGLKL